MLGPAEIFGETGIVGFDTIAVGGIFNCVPAYGNCADETSPFHANNSATVMPNRLETKIGESPCRTVYVCSTPTEPGGSVVTMFGNVVCTGGMV